MTHLGKGIMYIGDVHENGQPHGDGYMIDTKREHSFRGQFNNGRAHGNGTYTIKPEAKKITGTFFGGNAHGQCTVSYKSGYTLKVNPASVDKQSVLEELS